MQPGMNFDAIMSDLSKSVIKKAKEEELIRKLSTREIIAEDDYDPNSDNALDRYKTSNQDIEKKLTQYEIERDELKQKAQERTRSKSKQIAQDSPNKPNQDEFLEKLANSNARSKNKKCELADQLNEIDDVECTFTPEIDQNSKYLCKQWQYQPIHLR